MIPYARQHISQDDIAAVASALRSDWLTQGPQVAVFEKALALYCGVKYVVAVSNGTAALHIAYLAAGIVSGDEAITTPNTFVATTNMLLAVGVKPVFSDIRLDTYNLNQEEIEKHITKKTKVIVPVHFAGQSCDMSAIRSIAKKHKLLVIEDACHALGGQYRQKKIGSCAYSDMAVFSFHAIKSITTAEGGAVLTNNKKFYEKMLRVRSHGIHKDKSGFNVMSEFGYNYRLTELQAALGLSQLKQLNRFIAARRKVARAYQVALEGIPGIIAPTELDQNTSAWHLYVIRTKKASDRLPLYRHLQQSGIGINFHYPAVYSHPYYKKLGFKGRQCPHMELYGKTAITLPMHVSVSERDIKTIAQAIKLYFNV
ncbi:UDP-4-amino-4,6-dideoxy-N-acetyl-beta-L-altrosamine transaminase [bacterium CG10_46_32]|nr:MAG: UDP-4-amino-4,6-dideoxy-N-acetyl-beta-L-altrosamine transaminase [bacterium CG10_46_32]PIR56340.1 MAG: UDP-4-amino-4,6-dideoxy-N-acetyl-beta-L-altrosamine transaminase [Parcubacteria group bacterium CG10_big_fil_rev_8_21_14_0_10_46_32]